MAYHICQRFLHERQLSRITAVGYCLHLIFGFRYRFYLFLIEDTMFEKH